ncbi:MAG: hypothetical protein AAGE96_05065 [Cyanobacteria bacterium P01_G01_bin.19]
MLSAFSRSSNTTQIPTNYKQIKIYFSNPAGDLTNTATGNLGATVTYEDAIVDD